MEIVSFSEERKDLVQAFENGYIYSNAGFTSQISLDDIPKSEISNYQLIVGLENKELICNLLEEDLSSKVIN